MLSPWRKRRGQGLVVVGVVMALAVGGWAQGVFDIPHPTIAWWAVDAAASGGEVPRNPKRLAVAAAHVLMADEVIGDRTPALAAALIAGSLQCGVANRVVLLDLAGEPGERGGSWRCTGLSLVVEAGVESDEFALAVRASAGARGAVREAPLELPDGWAGTSFEADGLPAWRSVEVAIGGGRTLMGVGSGVLAQWLKPGEGAGPTASVQRAARGQDGGRAVLELMVDLDRLRAAAPARFSQSQVGRGLEALGLANARAFSLGLVRAADEVGVPVAAASVAARSAPAESAVCIPVAVKLSASAMDYEGHGGVSIALEAEPRRVIGLALGAARAWRTRFGATELDRAVERWTQSEGGRMALNVIGLPEVCLGFGVAAVGGQFVGRVMFPKANKDDVAAAIESLPGAMADGVGGWRVPLLEAADDPGGVLRGVEFHPWTDDQGAYLELRPVRP